MAGLSRPFEAAVMWHFTAGGGGGARRPPPPLVQERRLAISRLDKRLSADGRLVRRRFQQKAAGRWLALALTAQQEDDKTRVKGPSRG